MRGHDHRTLLGRVGIVSMLGLLVGCAGFPRGDGGPTPLRSNQTLSEGLAAIRAEFLSLHHPIVAGYHYNSPHEVGNWIEGYHVKKGTWEIKHTWGAHWFIRRHSRSELAAALFPLLADDKMVPEIAVVMDDLRYVGVRNTDEQTDSGLGYYLHDLKYGVDSLVVVIPVADIASLRASAMAQIAFCTNLSGEPGSVAGELNKIRIEY